MLVLGVDLAGLAGSADGRAEAALVLLDERGRIARLRRADSLAEVASGIAQLAGHEPFLAGVNIPIMVPPKPVRSRAIETLVRRRFGVALPHGGRAALAAQPLGVAGEALLAGLATAGHPCLPYPDRDRRQSGLAEMSARLCLKALLWQSSPLAGTQDPERLAELFRAYEPPIARAPRRGARAGLAEQTVALDLTLRLLGPVAQDYDLEPARQALAGVASQREVERAARLLDATLLAGTARRYLEAPETCLFLGDREDGYLILPADGFIRRLAAADGRGVRGRLFPEASLREQLGAQASIRPSDLLPVPGRSRRVDVSLAEPAVYEFDNVDEMLWWKHCRHLNGPALPTEGLRELSVMLGNEDLALGLVRSRHRTLSFRFDPPAAWRARVPTRDGKTYPFRVVRAIYETATAAD